MTGFISDYLVQLLPIIAGAAFVVVIMHVSIIGDHITIRTSSMPANSRAEPDRSDATPHLWREHAVESQRMRDATFEMEAYDALLVSGVMPRDKSAGALRRLAFRKLGIADICWFSRLENGSALQDTRLTLFVLDRTELLKHLLGFGGGSGILMQYLAGYALTAEAA